MSQIRFRVWVGMFFLVTGGGWSGMDQAFAQQGKEPPRFGNGAFLKRMFGNSEEPARGRTADQPRRPPQPSPAEAAAEKAKSSWEQARNATREGWEASRQRLKSDSDKLRERLGFKSAEEAAEAGKVGREASVAGRESIGDAQSSGRGPAVAWSPERSDEGPSRVPDPRSGFAPQGGTRSSIGDQALRDPAPRPSGDLRQVPGREAAAGANRGTAPVVAGGDSGPRALPPGGRLSDGPVVPGPVNQPRVPATPTFAPASNLSRSVVAESDTASAPAKFGAFGVLATPATPSGSGLVINSVRPKSVAAEIGLAPGDVITNVAGISVDFAEEIDSLVEVLEAEDEFDLTFVRGGKSQSKTYRMPAR